MVAEGQLHFVDSRYAEVHVVRASTDEIESIHYECRIGLRVDMQSIPMEAKAEIGGIVRTAAEEFAVTRIFNSLVVPVRSCSKPNIHPLEHGGVKAELK